MTRRSVVIVVALVFVQATALAAYWYVEERRAQAPAAVAPLSNTSPIRLESHAKVDLGALELRGEHGPLELRSDGRPLLLHFWATWCGPCRAELPGLLRASKTLDAQVVLVSLDKTWPQADAFIKERPGATLVLGNTEQIGRTFGIQTLPVTFLLGPEGEPRLRFDGARDWEDSGFRKSWEDAL